MPENLDTFFQDDLLTVPVVFGATETTGILDMPDQLLVGGLVESTAYSLLVKTSDFPTAPVAGDAITVDGEDYVVSTPLMKIDDGKLARIGLSKT